MLAVRRLVQAAGAQSPLRVICAMQSTSSNITSSIQDGILVCRSIFRSCFVSFRDIFQNKADEVTWDSLLQGVATLKMGRLPVNSLNYEFLTDLRQELEKLDEAKDCKAVIITSVTKLLDRAFIYFLHRQ